MLIVDIAHCSPPGLKMIHPLNDEMKASYERMR